MILLQLFWEFFKTGLFAVGGGMATVPFLLGMGSRTGWFSASQLADMIAVSESTPGPLGVNMATYVGFHISGLAGSIVATAGLIAPSLVISVILASLMNNFSKKPLVRKILYVLRAAVIGLLAYSFAQVAFIVLFDGNMLIKPVELVCFILITACILVCKVHPVVWIVLGALAGILLL